MSAQPSLDPKAASRLRLEPAIDDADAFYEALLDAHRGLDEAASAAFDARLILVLAQQIGKAEVLKDCIALALAAGRAQR